VEEARAAETARAKPTESPQAEAIDTAQAPATLTAEVTVRAQDMATEVAPALTA